MEFALLVLYGLILLRAAFASGRHTPDGFFVNNRESGPWSVGFSILVSCVGASATIGMVGMAFTAGTPAFWWLGVGAAGLALLSLALARAVRASGAYTLPHMAEILLGPSVRPAISAVIVVAWSAILAAQFSALCRVLEPLTGLASPACLLPGILLVCGHTLGGQSAIMRLDRIQALILLLALAATLIWLTRSNPAWPGSVELQAVNTEFPPEKLLHFLVIVGANYVICPMVFGRLFSARDERSARLGGLVGACGVAVCAALVVAVGLACKGLVPAGTPPDEVLTSALGAIMPHWMRLVVSFALISAIVSSADSCLITAATVLSFDLLGRAGKSRQKEHAAGEARPSRLIPDSAPACGPSLLPLWRGRACVLLLGLAGAALSLCAKDILGFLLMAYDVFAGGVVAPVFVGLLLYGKRRIDQRWSGAAVITGGLLGLAAAGTGVPFWSYAGMAVSGALTLGGAARQSPSSRARR